MKSKISGRSICPWSPLLALAWLVVTATQLSAQWAALGPQWLSPDGASSAAMALNRQHQVLAAAITNGAAAVQIFDGNAWQALGTGLPQAGQQVVALGMDEDAPSLALGPALAMYALDNGLWLPVNGLPAVANAHDLHLQVAHGHRRWLAWTQFGGFDSTFVLSDRGGTTWYVEGAFAGRLADMALDDNDAPVVLQQGASSLLQYQSGTWTSWPTFAHPSHSYMALVMPDDGSDNAVVLRRDPQGAIWAELGSNGNWQTLGTGSVAQGDVVDFEESATGILHIVAVDHAAQGSPRAFQFVAGDWQLLGGQYVYNNTVSQPHLAFDAATAYILFLDDEQSGRPSVVYLGTPQAADVGEANAVAECYPNPVGDVAHLRLHAPAVGAELRICDAQGRTCMQRRMGAEQVVDLPVGALPAGCYWLMVQRPHAAPQLTTFIKR